MFLKQQVRENGGTVDECTARAINNFAWGCVDHMTDLAISVPMDDRTAWLARHYRDITSDYEDASVLACCELSKASYLVTHDKRLAAQANIATKTASEDEMCGGNEFEVFHGSPFCFSTGRHLIAIAAPSPSGAFSNHALCRC